MSPSPFRSRLYRRPGQAVICVTLALLAGQFILAQTARKAKAKGPRATALVEIAPNGKAHLIPITIMVDGKFYDASAYKADPVPFALESEVVYEAMRTGVPQGEFTVSGALQAQDAWFGEGKWVPEGSKPKKKKVADNKPSLDDDSGPPTLRKAGGSKSSGAPTDTPASAKPSSSGSSAPAPSSPGTSPSPSAPADKSHSDDNHPATGSAQPSASADSDSSESANDEDPNRPSLRRGKPAASSKSTSSPSSSRNPSSAGAGTVASGSTPSKSASGKTSDVSKSAPPVQLIPAVSDASGPEPRPYSFIMKADEEQSYRKKLLVLASAEVASKAKEMTPVLPSAAPPKRTAAAKPAKPLQPVFDNIQIRSFDLSNTNEPVFVMTAEARMPASAVPKAPLSDSKYFITLVAEADIYLDLHKMLAQVTDDKHLDEFPRFELIDAVDADGDGRGELLFREVSDAGAAYAVYRAAADRLYPLFEGTPQRPHPHPVSD